MKFDESVYIRHILDAIARIEEYLRGVDQESFRHNHLIQDGVIRQIEIITTLGAFARGSTLLRVACPQAIGSSGTTRADRCQQPRRAR